MHIIKSACKRNIFQRFFLVLGLISRNSYFPNKMPVYKVTWLGEVPEPQKQQILISMLEDYVDEAEEAIEIVANYWPNCLQSEKVVLCGDSAFMGIVGNNLLALVPDVALNIPKLIWMCDTERVTISNLTLRNIRRAMSL